MAIFYTFFLFTGFKMLTVCSKMPSIIVLIESKIIEWMNLNTDKWPTFECVCVIKAISVFVSLFSKRESIVGYYLRSLTPFYIFMESSISIISVRQFLAQEPSQCYTLYKGKLVIQRICFNSCII